MVDNQAAQHQQQLQNYFDGIGFDRWAAIYGGEDDLSYVRRHVALGHARMLQTAQNWLLDSAPHGTLLDAGCGTGLFSMAMANYSSNIVAVDISPKMVDKAREIACETQVSDRIQFRQGAIETIQGQFDTIACFDVLVHYPSDLFVDLVTHLAQQCNKTLLITYAPYNRILATLHQIGGWFPKSNRRTEIQMIKDSVVEQALNNAGMSILRTASISQGFYHVKLLQAIFP